MGPRSRQPARASLALSRGLVGCVAPSGAVLQQRI